MEMHASLGLSGRAAGKRNQADIVGRRIASRTIGGLGCGQGLERIRTVIVKITNLLELRAIAFVAAIPAMFDFIGPARIAQHSLDFGLFVIGSATVRERECQYV